MTRPEDLYRDPTWLRYHYQESGMTVPEMANEVGCSRAVIRKWMKRYGIETTGRGFTPENTDYRDPEWMAFMYHESEYTMQDIADVCDVALSTIHRWMGKHNIKSREKGAHTMDINPMHNPDVVAAHPIAGARGEDHPDWKGEPSAWMKRDPWVSIRREIIRRDDHECVLCEMTRTEHYDEYGQDFDVHHIAPTSDGGDRYDPLNLMTLCRDCHNNVHTMYYNSTTTTVDSDWLTPETAEYA